MPVAWLPAAVPEPSSQWPFLRPKPAISRLGKIRFGPGRVLGCPVAVSGPPRWFQGPPKMAFFCCFFLLSGAAAVAAPRHPDGPEDAARRRRGELGGGRRDTGLFWGSLGHFGGLGHLGTIWSHSGGALGQLRAPLKDSRVLLGGFKVPRRFPGLVLGGLGDNLGCFGPPPGHFGVFWAPPGPFWGVLRHLGGVGGILAPFLGCPRVL